MGKAFRPTVAALSNVGEDEITCRLYCDNAAAVQNIKFRRIWLHHHAEDVEYQEVHFTWPG